MIRFPGSRSECLLDLVLQEQRAIFPESDRWDMANNDGMNDEKQTLYRRTAGFDHLGGGRKGLVIEDFFWSYREKPSDSVLHASCAK